MMNDQHGSAIGFERPPFQMPANDVADLASVEPLKPSIDLPSLMQRCFGNRNFLLLLLEEFVATLPQQVAEITSLAASQDSTGELARAVHSFKGTAATMAASMLQNVAADIEVAVGAGEWHRVATLIERLRLEVRRCLAEIPQRLI